MQEPKRDALPSGDEEVERLDNCASADNVWLSYLDAVAPVRERLEAHCSYRTFWYQHPQTLQRSEARFRKDYPVRVSYVEWGAGRSLPVLLCVGGVANTAMRFSFLGESLQSDFHVVCMDWVGRGYSGWLRDEHDYVLDTYVEQLRQMIVHLGLQSVQLLGSSLGGTVAIALAALQPGCIARLVLNDIGPYMPRERRQRRSETLARHYVFRSPHELLRKVGASQKNDGPVSEEERMFITFHQTRWSEEDGGRVYRHDVRALQAYRSEATRSLDQWSEWQRFDAPTLVIHGMESDALSVPTVRRMQKRLRVSVMHVPETGHTPLLADFNQISFIHDWLCGNGEATEWTCLLDR